MSRSIVIDFLGVWYSFHSKFHGFCSLTSSFRDTVASVGLTGRTLPFTSYNAIIKTFRQALALDERRTQFRHNPWSEPSREVREEVVVPPSPVPAEEDFEEKVKRDRLVDFSERGTSLWAEIKRVVRRQQVETTYWWADGYSEQRNTEEEQLSKAARAHKMIRKVTGGRKKVDACRLYWGGENRFACPECRYRSSRTDSREVWFAGAHSGGSLKLGRYSPHSVYLARCRRRL